MSAFILAFLREEEGSNAIEYVLIAALIAIVLVVGATSVGDELNTFFTRVAGCVQNPTPAC